MIDGRRPLQALLGLVFALCARAAAAQAGTPTLVLQVSPDAGEIDAAALRDGLGSELGMRLIAQDDESAPTAEGTFRIGVDRDKSEIVVEYRRRAGGATTRRLPLPIDRSVLQRTLVFLAGNMARDESAGILRDLDGDAVAPAAAAASPVHRPRPPSPMAPPPRRYWVGVSLEGAATGVPAGADVCRQGPTGSISPNGFYCVLPGGQDYSGPDPKRSPMNPGGDVLAGIRLASSRFTVSVDYLLFDNWLVGGRFGFAVDGYPGNAAELRGHTWGPTHLELRATYVLGEGALARPGVRFAATVGVGVAEWDTRVPVAVNATDTPPQAWFPVDAWRVEAGLFASVAVGPRIAVGERVAFLLNVAKVTAVAAVISRTGPELLYTPEVAMEVGF